MNNILSNLLSQPIFIIILCAILGRGAGKLGYKYARLGSSATLFIGLAFSYLTGILGIEIANIPKELFNASLIAFIVSVGLKASNNIKAIIKAHGIKFVLMAICITSAGALSTFVIAKFLLELRYEIIGTYVGALTSSPGLAAALESAKGLMRDPSGNIGLGYAVAYIPGVIIVILFSMLMGRNKNRNAINSSVIKNDNKKIKGFDISKFFIVIILGILLGTIEIDVGLNTPFSMGITGGVLISALIFGSSVKGYEFDDKMLSIIRDLGLDVFLAIVGINYGYSALSSIQSVGLILLAIGTFTGLVSILSGYLFGRLVLKMDYELLTGSICGGMTSTPGLAAAIEAFDGEEVVAGYGATYPFALMSMLIWTNILFK